MSLLPEFFTSKDVQAMRARLEQALAPFAAPDTPVSSESAGQILAGTLGFSSWEDLEEELDLRAFFNQENVEVHPGLSWFANDDGYEDQLDEEDRGDSLSSSRPSPLSSTTGNRRLLWRALLLNCKMQVPIAESLQSVARGFANTSAPPEVAEVVQKIAKLVARSAWYGDALPRFLVLYDRDQAVMVQVQSRFGCLDQTLQKLAREVGR